MPFSFPVLMSFDMRGGGRSKSAASGSPCGGALPSARRDDFAPPLLALHRANGALPVHHRIAAWPLALESEVLNPPGLRWAMATAGRSAGGRAYAEASRGTGLRMSRCRRRRTCRCRMFPISATQKSSLHLRSPPVGAPHRARMRASSHGVMGAGISNFRIYLIPGWRGHDRMGRAHARAGAAGSISAVRDGGGSPLTLCR